MIDLRAAFESYQLPPRKQGPRGTCSVFAVTGALEYALAERAGSGTRLSVEFLNWAAHRAVNRTVDGGFFHELWAGYQASGICAEDALPYRAEFDADLMPPAKALRDAAGRLTCDITLHWIKKWNPRTGLSAYQSARIKSTLEKRRPVLGGLRWPKKPEWTQTILQMCPPNEVYDGHSVLLIGYLDDEQQPGGGLFLIRNSGGDGFDGYLSYEYVAAYMNDAAFIK